MKLRRRSIVMKWKHNGGFTLVEMIVTFALLGILLTAGTVCISASLTQYNHVKINADAQSVADTLLGKITGEIAGARYGATAKYTMTIKEDGHCISLCNRQGSAIYIKATSEGDTYTGSEEAMPVGRLLIHYRPIKDQVSYEAEDWMFDTDAYMGYVIKNLHFQLYEQEGRKTNVVLVTMTLTSTVTSYTYTATQAVELYNFTSATAVNNINLKQPVLTDEEYLETIGQSVN